MLALFSKPIAHAPEELCIPSTSAKQALDLLHAFASSQPNVVQLSLKDAGALAYTHHKQALLSPRSFAAVDGIFCLFEGHLENLPVLRQEYGLTKNVSEVLLIIEAYRALRDRGPYPADQVVSGLSGRFLFILFDTTNQNVFVATDKEAKVPLHWGTTVDGYLAFSNIQDMLKEGCGASFAPFPAGCYFSSKIGLRSYEHPLQKITPVPRVDSQGQELAAVFKVDMSKQLTKQESGIHRVGSEANWAESI